MNDFGLLLCLGVATASLAYTTTRSPMFYFIGDAVPNSWPLVRVLIACPYCMSHWVGAVWVGIFQPEPFRGWWIDFVPDVFIIVTIAALIVKLIEASSHAQAAE